MINIKLMIVEDDTVLLSRLEKILKREVGEVYAFSSPKEALKAFKTINPDIVLTDIKMPEMNGLEMISNIRTSNQHIPVIIASAFSEPEYFQKAIKLKVENFVIKPIEVDVLIDELKSIEEQQTIINGFANRGKLLEEYKSIVDTSNNISKTDTRGVITYINSKFAKLSGYSKKELIGKPHSIMRHPDMTPAFFKRLWKTILDKKVWHGTIKNLTKSGETFYVETVIAPILDENNNIVEFISIKNDVTSLVKHQDILQHQINTDLLTQIPNRVKLNSDLYNLLTPSIILVDIDKFKEVNNLFGLYFGDQILIYLAQTLKKICDLIGFTYYRISADEFILLADNQKEEDLIEVVKKVMTFLNDYPFEHNGISFNIQLSFGIALSSNEREKNMLLAMADAAMQTARKSPSSYGVYSINEDPQKEYENNFTWNQNLKKALAEDRITIYYQPIVSTVNNQEKKYECLVRYIDEDGKVYSPFFFLEVAKRSRLYPEITKTVITKACKTFSNRDEKFSINLSIEDILNVSTIEFLIQEVKKYNLERQLIVEILESEGIDNYGSVINVIENLKTNGVEIAIDDFGTGYSNFAYLISLDINTLKIDGSLVKDIDTNLSSKAIVKSIVSFAKELNIRTVAEFVSSENIYNVIKEIGVDYAQGYYLSEPIPFDQLPNK